MSPVHFLLSWVSIALCSLAASAQGPVARPNLLVIVADDVGVDVVGAYGEHPVPARTPNLDRLAANGVLFRNLWVNPKCSPTRTTILSGRYAYRTGIGDVTSFATSPGPGVEFGVDPAQLDLPARLKTVGYSSAAVGKWHLATNEGAAEQGYRHAALAGFDVHVGPIENAGYFLWSHNVATRTYDAQSVVSGYSTSRTVDDALSVVERSGDAPWFLWVAFNAAHSPFHRPPDDLLSDATVQSLPAVPAPAELYRAMVEAMDTEIGRLLSSLSPLELARTLVVIVGDNGTPNATTTPPSTLPAKGSLREGGVRAPLIIVGHGIAAPGREVHALVNGIDLHATLLELAGVRPAPDSDARSLVPYLVDPGAAPRRQHVYSELFKPNGFGPYSTHARTARSARYKLVRNELTGVSLFFDLRADPDEQDNLLGAGASPLTAGQQAAYDALASVLAENALN